MTHIHAGVNTSFLAKELLLSANQTQVLGTQHKRRIMEASLPETMHASHT